MSHESNNPSSNKAAGPASKDPAQDAAGSAFEAAAQGKDQGLIAEFWDFLKHNKKWWLAPILVTMGLVMGLIVLGQAGAAPFIYTLF